MAIDELCIALQMEDCKMEVDKEENSKAVDKPKTTTLGKSVIIPNILVRPKFLVGSPPWLYASSVKNKQNKDEML